MTKLESGLGESYLIQIGRIVANFSLLEEVIGLFVGKLLDNPIDVGQIVVSELSFRNLLSLFSSLYLYWNDDKALLAEFDDLLKIITNLEQKRNQIIHSIWTGGISSVVPAVRIKITAKQSRGHRVQVEEITVDMLARFADEIAEASYNLNKLMLKQ